MRIFILLGNPDKETLSGEMATLYEEEAKKAGHEVRRANIGDLQFDPILHKGYKEIQALEPDLKKVQEDMTWAEHFVLIYPLWWSGMPALLKGVWDRMCLPGFAFKFYKGPGMMRHMSWEKMLKGRTARVIVLSKSPGWLIRLLFGDYSNEIERAILGFSGYKVKLSEIGHSEDLPPAKKAQWIRRVTNLARKGK